MPRGSSSPYRLQRGKRVFLSGTPRSRVAYDIGRYTATNRDSVAHRAIG
jgi:hypothetical protein